MKTKPIIKNFLTRAAMTLAAVLMTSATAWADEWDETTKTLTITYYFYPETYKGRTDIEHLVFDYWLDWMGAESFSGCTGLKTVTFEKWVEYIPEQAFKGCTSLTSVTLPNGLKSIMENAFEGCTSLTSINLPNGLKSIKESAFKGCTSLTSATLPNSLGSIESYTFEGCTGLTSVTLPDGLGAIGSNAFKDCTSLTSVTLPDGLGFIGSSAFEGCTSLTSITIPSNARDVQSNAFKDCTNITTVIDMVTGRSSNIEDLFGNVSSSCHFYFHSQSMYDINKDDYGDRITVFSGIRTYGGAIATTSAEPVITFGDTDYYTTGTQFTISHGDAPYGYHEDFKGYQVKNASGDDITATALSGTTLTLLEGDDISVTALYDLAEYTITYDLNGGELECGVGNTVYPTTYTVFSKEIKIDYDYLAYFGPNGIPCKDGYEFLGWTGPGYEEPTKVIVIPSGSYGNRTYTANWKRITYTIIYYLEGGSLPEGVTNPTSYTVDTETFTLNNPTRKGYEFRGWWASFDDKIEKIRTIPKGSSSNMWFHAYWTYILSDAIDLADNADNAALISEYEDLSVKVTLQGRTLYRDGDWNTLTVPFSITDADDADGISFTGTPLEGATVKTLSSSAFSNGTLTLNFEDATSIEAGKPYIVKWDGAVNLTINSTTDWNAFAESVNGGKLYAGKTVLLGADINVSTMVGTAEHPFSGTFEGAGHTLNVSISDGGDGAAPFRYISGATICNVKTTGSVSGGNYSAGLVGIAVGGTNSIRNCYAAASVSGGSYASGILGNGTTSTTTISSCMFDGYLSATNMGVFCGWGESGSTQTAENSVAYGTYADLSIIIDEGSGRSIDLLLGNGTKTVTNCFRNKSTFSQGDYWLIMHMGGDHPLRYDYLGSNWTYDNGQFALNPTVNLVDTNIKNPAFPNVMVDATASSVETTWVDFVGTYEPLSFSDADPSILFLGTESKLYYPLSGAYIGAQRAFFRLKGIAAGDTHNQARAFVLNFGDSETTGILSTTNLTNYTNSDAWYDLSGRRLSGKPTQKGLYINNGRKVVIK